MEGFPTAVELLSRIRSSKGIDLAVVWFLVRCSRNGRIVKVAPCFVEAVFKLIAVVAA